MLYTSRYQLPPPLEIQMILVWIPLARVDVIHYKIETEQAQWLHYNFYFGKSHVLSFKSTGWVKYKSKFKVSHTTIQIITPTLRLVRLFLLWGKHFIFVWEHSSLPPPTSSSLKMVVMMWWGGERIGLFLNVRLNEEIEC